MTSDRPPGTEEAFFGLATHRDGTTLRLVLAGEFDWAVVGHVEGALASVRALPLEHIIFDLANLTFLDLAGLRTILHVDSRAQADGLTVTVVRPRGLANRVFTLTRAGETLSIVDSA